jgi:hypothetical protein
MYETFGSHQNATPAVRALVRLWRIAKLPGWAMTVMPITEEEKELKPRFCNQPHLRKCAVMRSVGNVSSREN